MTKLYYSAKDATGIFGLWVSDGTALGTTEIVGKQGAYSLSPDDFVGLDGGVVFAGDDASGQSGVWIANGAGAVELAPGSDGVAALLPHFLTRVGAYIVFSG